MLRVDYEDFELEAKESFQSTSYIHLKTKQTAPEEIIADCEGCQISTQSLFFCLVYANVAVPNSEKFSDC